MRIEYIEVAISDLIRSRNYIVDHNPHAAKNAATKFVVCIKSLVQHPQLGLSSDGAPEAEKICGLMLPLYIVRYAVFSRSVRILRIWHQKEEREDESIT